MLQELLGGFDNWPVGRDRFGESVARLAGFEVAIPELHGDGACQKPVATHVSCHANGEPVEGSRVVALRDDGVRWARDTDAAGVVGFKRGGGKIEVVVRAPEGWFYRTVVDLNDAFVDVDLPRQPGRTDRLDDLSVEVRAAFD